MHSVKLELLPAARTPDPEVQKSKETETLLKLMKPGDTLILCDERGKTFSSRGFATYIEKTLSQSRGKIIFAIGGAYGFTDKIRNQYPSIRLSDFVFPHQLARLVLTEQIYRALNILKGTGYHHD